MNIVVSQIGIDVGKEELVVCIDQGKPFACSNTAKGCLEIIEKFPAGAVVHLEASGGYERLVRRLLSEHGFTVVVHNPLKSRRIAQAQGVRAKTDPVDAKLLSRSGHLLPQETVKRTERQQLADHSRAIDTLKAMVMSLKQSQVRPELDSPAKQLYAEAILALQQQIAAAEKEFEVRVKASDCAESYQLIQTVPSLGKLTARRCICELPEDVMERSTGQIASYAGLAPVDDSSGKRTGRSRLGNGNSRLKAAFYMPALCAIRHEAWAKDLYQRLRSNKKSHQTATVAVMRRLLIRAVAVIKRQKRWVPDTQNA